MPRANAHTIRCRTVPADVGFVIVVPFLVYEPVEKYVMRCEGTTVRMCDGALRECEGPRSKDNRTFAPDRRTFAARTVAPSDR